MHTKLQKFVGIWITLVLITSALPAQTRAMALSNSVITSHNQDPYPFATVFQLQMDKKNAALTANSSDALTIGSILYEQYSPFSNWAVISQNFDSAYDSLDGEAADDFTIPKEDGVWEIESIEIVGACNKTNGTGVFDCMTLNSANVRIYSDNNGAPGDPVYSTDAQPVESGTPSAAPLRMYSIVLNTPAVLASGTYWLSVQINMDYSFGEWGWIERNAQNGSWHVYRNPNGGWEQGCITWCVHWYHPDLTFSLKGNIGGNSRILFPTIEVSDLVEHPSQPLIYVSHGENSVAVINTDTYKVLTDIPVGFFPSSLAISPDGTRVFVATRADYGTIEVIDTFTNTVIVTFISSMYPSSLAFGGPGRLYVAGSGISSWDPFTGAFIEGLPQLGFLAANKLAISPDGKTLCSAAVGSSTDVVNCHNISSDAPPPPLAAHVCEYIYDIDISSDGIRLYVACGGSWNTTDGNIPGRIMTLDLGTLAKIDELSVNNGSYYPSSLLDSVDGKFLFESIIDTSGSHTGSDVRLLDSHTYAPLRSLDHGEVQLLDAGKDNHTIYARLDDPTSHPLIIYKYGTFQDVSWKHWGRNSIERLYGANVTSGCSVSPLMFCPESQVTRAQMAVFLLKGIHGSSYTPPVVGGATGFGDVSTDYWAAAWIKQLAAEGVTGGCGNGNFCPDNPVTRAQMAVFLLKAEHGSAYAPPSVGGSTGFGDVATAYWASAWIKQLAAEAITGGCGGGNYCPDNPVTRAQMAVFLVKTFKLP